MGYSSGSAGGLSSEEEERLRRVFPDGPILDQTREHFQSLSPSERVKLFDALDNIPGSLSGGRARAPLDLSATPFNKPPHTPFDTPIVPSQPTCDRCSSRLHGAYYSFNKPGGGKADLCKKCARRVRLRLRMLAAKPNSEARGLAKSALKDLHRARRIDPTSEQVQTNLRSISPLLAAARGSPILYLFFWVPLWMLVLTWDLVKYPLMTSVYWGWSAGSTLWQKDGAFRALAVVVWCIPVVVILWLLRMVGVWIKNWYDVNVAPVGRRYY